MLIEYNNNNNNNNNNNDRSPGIMLLAARDGAVARVTAFLLPAH
jgi:hypothetical protein